MDGVLADRFTDVTMLLGHDPKSYANLMSLYRQMGMEEKNVRDMERLMDAIQIMELRNRFNSDMTPGVFLVKSECEITGEQMDALLTMKQRDGTLRDFLRAARIF
jgi:hypothetical protein